MSEWSEWFEHDGTHVPAGITGKLVHAVFNGRARTPSGEISDGFVSIATGNPAAWIAGLSKFHIIRFRIRRPKALLDLIERARELDDAPEGPIRAPAKPGVTV